MHLCTSVYKLWGGVAIPDLDWNQFFLKLFCETQDHFSHDAHFARTHTLSYDAPCEIFPPM